MFSQRVITTHFMHTNGFAAGRANHTRDARNKPPYDSRPSEQERICGVCIGIVFRLPSDLFRCWSADCACLYRIGMSVVWAGALPRTSIACWKARRTFSSKMAWYVSDIDLVAAVNESREAGNEKSERARKKTDLRCKRFCSSPYSVCCTYSMRVRRRLAARSSSWCDPTVDQTLWNWAQVACQYANKMHERNMNKDKQGELTWTSFL